MKKKYGIIINSFQPKVMLFNTYEEIVSFAISSEFEHGYEMFELEYFSDFLGKENVIKITMNKSEIIFAIAGSNINYIFSNEEKKWKIQKSSLFPRLYYEALWESGFKFFYNPYKADEEYTKVIRKKMQEI